MKKRIRKFIIKQVIKKKTENYYILCLQLLLGVGLVSTTFIFSSSSILQPPDKSIRIITILLTVAPIGSLFVRLVCMRIVRKIGISDYTGKMRFFHSTFFKILPAGANKVEVYFKEKIESAFHFAENRNQIHTASTINSLAYIGSIWEGTIEEKFIRNYAHFNKSPHVIQLILDNDTAIGFTHIIPVTEDVYAKYKNGEISDKDFQAIHVAANSDNVAGIIIFSVACLCNKSIPEKYDLIYEGLLYHIHFHLKNRKNLKVLMPNCDKKFMDPLAAIGFRRNESKSKDNTPIYEVELLNSMESSSSRKSASDSGVELNPLSPVEGTKAADVSKVA